MDISGEIRGLLEKLSTALAEHDGLPTPGPTHLFAAHHQISETARRELDGLIAQRQPVPPVSVITDDIAPAADNAELAPETASAPNPAETGAPVEKPVALKKTKSDDGNAPSESSGEGASDEER